MRLTLNAWSLTALFFVVFLPFVFGFWPFLSPPPQLLVPADINGQDIRVGLLIADTIDANRQLIRMDVNIINDLNVEGDTNFFGPVSFGDKVFGIDAASDSNFVSIGLTESLWGGASTIIQGNKFQCNSCVASGGDSVAIGSGTTASGNGSFATGSGTTASGIGSFAAGLNCNALQTASFCLGRDLTNYNADSILVRDLNVLGKDGSTEVTPSKILEVIGGEGGKGGEDSGAGDGAAILIMSGRGGEGDSIHTGVGGTIDITGGEGGEADDFQNGGLGATINITAGQGGDATGEDQEFGGTGGNLVLSAGAAGAGNSGSGVAGNILFKIGTTIKSVLNNAGNLIVFSKIKTGANANPTQSLDITGNSIIRAGGQHLLRDTTIGIYSQADSFMDLFADGAIRIGDSAAGQPTNYFQISSDGNLAQFGTNKKAAFNGLINYNADSVLINDANDLGDSFVNMVYGFAYDYNEAIFPTIDLHDANIAVYINIIGGSTNNVTFADSNFTIVVPGFYEITGGSSFSGQTANQMYGLMAAKDNVEINECHAHRQIGTGSDIGNISFNCVIQLAKDEKITLQIENETLPVSDPAISDARLTIKRIHT